MERNGVLASFRNVRDSRYKDDAVNVRCCLMRYLNEEGRVDWQLNMLEEHKKRTIFSQKKQLCTMYYQKLDKN